MQSEKLQIYLTQKANDVQKGIERADNTGIFETTNKLIDAYYKHGNDIPNPLLIAVDISEAFKSEKLPWFDPDVKLNIVRAFHFFIQLSLIHNVQHKDKIVSEEMKKVFLKSILRFEKLNGSTNVLIDYEIDCIKQAINAMTDNSPQWMNALGTVAKIVAGKNVALGVSAILEVKQKVTQKWYLRSLGIRRLGAVALEDGEALKKLESLVQQIKNEKSGGFLKKKTNWHVTFTIIDILGNISLNGKNASIRKSAFDIWKRYSLEEHGHAKLIWTYYLHLFNEYGTAEMKLFAQHYIGETKKERKKKLKIVYEIAENLANSYKKRQIVLKEKEEIKKLSPLMLKDTNVAETVKSKRFEVKKHESEIRKDLLVTTRLHQDLMKIMKEEENLPEQPSKIPRPQSFPSNLPKPPPVPAQPPSNLPKPPSIPPQPPSNLPRPQSFPQLPSNLPKPPPVPAQPPSNLPKPSAPPQQLLIQPQAPIVLPQPPMRPPSNLPKPPALPPQPPMRPPSNLPQPPFVPPQPPFVPPQPPKIMLEDEIIEEKEDNRVVFNQNKNQSQSKPLPSVPPTMPVPKAPAIELTRAVGRSISIQLEQTLNTHVDKIYNICLSKDGEYLVSAAESIKVWSTKSNECIRTINISGIVSLYATSKVIVSGTKDGIIYIFDLLTGNVLHWWQAHYDRVCSICVTKDEQFIISASWDNLTIMWSMNGSKVRLLEDPNITGYLTGLVTCRNYIITSSSCSILSIWDNDRIIQTWSNVHGDIIECVAVNRNETQLASCSSDQTITIWDIINFKGVTTLKGHSNIVVSVAWIEQRYLVSYSDDYTLKIWDVAKGTCEQTIIPNCARIRNIRYKNRRVYACSEDGKILIFKVKL